jgi:hypothetical protein
MAPRMNLHCKPTARHPYPPPAARPQRRGPVSGVRSHGVLARWPPSERSWVRSRCGDRVMRAPLRRGWRAFFIPSARPQSNPLPGAAADGGLIAFPDRRRRGPAQPRPHQPVGSPRPSGRRHRLERAGSGRAGTPGAARHGHPRHPYARHERAGRGAEDPRGASHSHHHPVRLQRHAHGGRGYPVAHLSLPGQAGGSRTTWRRPSP